MFVVECVALYLATQIATGLVFEKGPQSLILTAAALTVASLLVRPIINILLLPINLLTFGIFRWVSHAIVFFLVDLVLSEFSIQGFNFPGFHSQYLDLPATAFNPGVASYLAFSFLIAIITSFIYWLVK